MADEQQQTAPPPQQVTEPLGNTPEARNPDGSLKDTQTPPTQTSEAKPEPKTEAAPQSTEGAPEKYEFKAPDGYEFDKDLLSKAETICRELNLPQAAAEKVVGLLTEASLSAGEAPYKFYEDMRKGWLDSAIKDPAIGNGKDGMKPEVEASIGRLLNSLPASISKDFREALDITGAGDNPVFIKAFHNLAQRLGEGTLVKGGGPSPGGQGRPGAAPSAAQAMYPNLPSSAH